MTDAIHDFTAKLRQPSLLPHVETYVRWRKEVGRARAQGIPAPDPPDLAPLSINLDLTTACNFRCDHCIDWHLLNTRHRHDEESLRSSICNLVERGLRSVILIGGGEPTIHPGFSDFVGFLKDLELDIAIVSNGSRGDKLLEIAHLLGPRDWIRLSLDASSNELFQRMHRPVKRSLSLDDICAWVPKIKARAPQTRIGFSYIIIWQGTARDDVALHDNVQEIVPATERARRYGFDYIALKPVLGRASNGAEIMEANATGAATPEIIERIREQVTRAATLATDSFDVHVSTNLRALQSDSWRDYTRQPRTCHMQFLRQVLSPMGLYNCPAHRDVPKARFAEGDAWASADSARQTQRKLAALMTQFDASAECREVTCLYNATNWWLEKMIEDPRSGIDLEPSLERLDFFL